MNIRLAIACALAASLAGGAAHAAPRKVCNLLGAGRYVTPYQHTAEPAVTIRSADLASNRTHLTAVVRLGSVEDTTGPVARGRIVKFHFSRGEQNYVIETTLFDTAFHRQRFGTTNLRFDKRSAAERGESGPGAGADVQTFDFVTDGVKVVVDTRANEVRMTIPLSHFRLTPSPAPKTGSRVTWIGVDLHRINGLNRYAVDGYPAVAPAGYSEPASYVAGNHKVSYALGTPSCVVPGR